MTNAATKTALNRADYMVGALVGMLRCLTIREDNKADRAASIEEAAWFAREGERLANLP